jgi:23S rRNA (uracil1939-C5)-methyltransferase
VPHLRTVVLNENTRKGNAILGENYRTLWGDGVVEGTLCGLKFRLSPASFYQVNRDQAERLYGIALDFAGLTGQETVLDLYCGTGTITLCLAGRCKEAIGVEIVPEAIEDAKENAQNNGIENARFFCADALEASRRLQSEGTRPHVVVVDPPRKGLSADVIPVIAGMNPQKVVYVSCDPATLARDVALFREEGYILQKATAVDLFPRTHHVETVVCLSRKKVNDRINFDINIEALPDRVSKTATYAEIKAYVLEHYGFKVSSLYIAQIKDKHGIKERENYNIGEGKSKELICPPEKEEAITNALKHFNMI